MMERNISNCFEKLLRKVFNSYLKIKTCYCGIQRNNFPHCVNNSRPGEETNGEKLTEVELELSDDELLIAFLLYHFQAGIQYNLHAVYQVKIRT